MLAPCVHVSSLNEVVNCLTARGSIHIPYYKCCMQYCELLHEYKASKNAPHEYNKRDRHANECNKRFTATVSCLFSHKVPSNSPFECTSSSETHCSC